MMENPYTLLFGVEPEQVISRLSQSSVIIDSFERDHPVQQVYMITGIRGCGKTVFMTEIANRLKKNDKWIVLELNPETDLLEGLASKLSSENSLAAIFKNANINLSLLGFGVEISGITPITNIETAITKMLEAIQKKGKRVLITIDEVSNTRNMRIFASAYQIFVRQKLPVFLLMTGLYENVQELQNEKSMTFLYRAPKVELRPLNLDSIAKSYVRTLSLDQRSGIKMAHLTKGYSFAFQVLGYFSWEVGGNYNAVLDDYRQYLEDYVYEKLWSELSKTDQTVAYAIARSSTGKVSDIMADLKMEKNYFSNYRSRLLKRGLLSGEPRGYLSFTLPMFAEFVISKCRDDF